MPVRAKTPAHKPSPAAAAGPLVYLGPGETDRAAALLEAGHVVVLRDLDFDLGGAEGVMYSPMSDDRAKNVSFNPKTGVMKGAAIDGEAREALQDVVARYSGWAEALVKRIIPGYAAALQTGKTSYRPRSADEPMSPRKDDRRLHVDAFPSQPVQGRRILRVFRNVNPEGQLRHWRVGEPFADHVARFLPKARPMPPGKGLALQALGVTKGRRTGYDELMLQIHDASKEDDGYQANGPRWDVAFAPGETWMVYTDGVVHAALGGRYAFEQTFFLPVEAMSDPAVSPLRTLERMTGKTLV